MLIYTVVFQTEKTCVTFFFSFFFLLENIITEISNKLSIHNSTFFFFGKIS